jgi:hypothetical protein
MMPPLPINNRYDTRDSRWRAAGQAQARMRPLDSQPVAPPSLSPTARPARSSRQPPQCLRSQRPQRLRRSYILLPDPAANSP